VGGQNYNQVYLFATGTGLAAITAAQVNRFYRSSVVGIDFASRYCSKQRAAATSCVDIKFEKHGASRRIPRQSI